MRARGLAATALLVLSIACSQPASEEPRAGSSSPTGSARPPELVAEIDTGAGPNFLGVAAGAVWVSETDSGRLARIDPATNEVTEHVRLGPGAAFLTTGLGYVWVTGFESGKLWRVDPRSLEVDAIRLPSGAFGVATGMGSVFVAGPDTGSVYVIDPDPLEQTGAFRVEAPEDVVVASGKLWATSGDDEVVAIDLATDDRKTIDVPEGAHSLAAGAGSIWVGPGDAGNAVTRIAPSGRVVGTVEGEIGTFMDRFAFSNGLAWVGQFEGGSVAGIDPTTMEIVRELPTGNGAAVVTAGFGDLWIANFYDYTVWRLDDDA